MAASTICWGVLKSGWPMPRLTMSLPCRCRSAARASTSKAVSVPRRFRLSTSCSMAFPPTLPRLDARLGIQSSASRAGLAFGLGFAGGGRCVLHRVGVLVGREGAVAHLDGVGGDGLADGLTDLAELLDELRHAW